MRIIGPPEYQPEITCLEPPFFGERMTEARLKAERKRVLEHARRKREARLRCPECGDSLKVRLHHRWFCRHCLMDMTDLGLWPA